MVDVIEMLKALILDPNSNGILVLIFIVLGALILKCPVPIRS